jgi:hypothetical protein
MYIFILGLKFGAVELNDISVSSTMKVSINQFEAIPNDKNSVDKTLLFKDQTLISDKFYGGIFKQFNLKESKFPTLYAIKKRRRLVDYTGDSCNVGRYLKLLNFTFCL